MVPREDINPIYHGETYCAVTKTVGYHLYQATSKEALDRMVREHRNSGRGHKHKKVKVYETYEGN